MLASCAARASLQETRPLVKSMKIRKGSRNLDTPAEGKEVKTEGSNQTTRRVLPWPAEAMSAGLMRELGRALQEEIEARV